jgi:hypothetical protein
MNRSAIALMMATVAASAQNPADTAALRALRGAAPDDAGQETRASTSSNIGLRFRQWKTSGGFP